jgi:transposase
VLGILRDDRQKTLRQYLTELPDEVKGKVKEVAIDMNERARVAIEKELKGAKVVVDPFHVIQDANQRFDEARRLEQQMSHREIKKNHFC